ncbi:MAG: serine/threonine-protein kinase [Elainellaceae cyanobacterium]
MLNVLKNEQDGEKSQILGGRYQILRQLAAGGFGQTFLAQDRHLPGHPVCVIKQLKPRFSDASSLKTARRLFDTEAEVLYELGSHPQIPRLMAHFEENKEFYLAQEYVDGEPLDTVLIDGRPWPVERGVALLQDLLQVLAFVHDKNVIHRDIKPSNLLCRRDDGHIVLIDFGAVKQVNTQFIESSGGPTNLTVSIGTQGYMPSEQTSGQPRFSSDVYAVGMVVIQALTGVKPQHLAEDPKTGEVAWREANPSATAVIDPALAKILDRMVYYDFRSRYPTALAALTALRDLPTELLEALPDQWYSPRERVEADSPAPKSPPQRQSPAPLGSGQPTEVVIGRPTSGLSGTVADSLQATEDDRTAVPVTPLRVLSSLFTAQRRWLLALLAGAGGLVLLWSLRPADQTATSTDPGQTVTEVTASENSSGSSDENLGAEDQAPADEPPPPNQAANVLLQDADALRQQEDYGQAIAVYDQVIAADSGSAAAYWGKCYSLNRSQQPDAAIAACDQALALDPNNPDALSSKGYALQLQDRPEAALALFNQALAQSPSNADILTNKGTALLSLQQSQAALEAFDQAIAAQPDHPEAWNNRGAALWDLQRFEEAVNSVEEAIALRPDYDDAKALRKEMRKRLKK